MSICGNCRFWDCIAFEQLAEELREKVPRGYCKFNPPTTPLLPGSLIIQKGRPTKNLGEWYVGDGTITASLPEVQFIEPLAVWPITLQNTKACGKYEATDESKK